MNSEKKYLFIVCPNQSGSSLIYRHIGNCDNVSKLPTEGQLIYGGGNGPVNENAQYEGKPFSFFKEFSQMEQYNWIKIKEVWGKNWDKSKKVLLEKSPPNVCRAKLLEEQFDNSYFILTIRNPYAFCEGNRRRCGYKIDICIQHWINCAKFQLVNMSVLNNCIFFKYEDLSENTKYVENYIKCFINELEDLDLSKRIAVHSIDDVAGFHRKHIKNYNDEQIENLNNCDIREINEYLKKEQRLMEIFGYAYIG